ncbi:MAG TPA: hypothetical protein VNY05_28260 [Candidatus Acidoferrales bacterium]|jgi:hypothetical protein|nr:hypothetical protein [Candidatus Acidoferrales bacterium]
MWAQVETDLQKLFAAKIYSGLLTDAVYRKFLTLAGFGPQFPRDLKSAAPSVRENLVTAAGIQAHIAVAEVAKSGGLEVTATCAKLIGGPLTLYRFWDSSAPERRVGVWWFHGSVIDACQQHAGKSFEARKEWLREHLAVCLDWSAMDRIDTLSLTAADELPAIEGTGAPMRIYSAAALPNGKVASKDYWPNLGKYFPGGLKQIVLPFVPRAQGRGSAPVLEPELNGAPVQPVP